MTSHKLFHISYPVKRCDRLHFSLFTEGEERRGEERCWSRRCCYVYWRRRPRRRAPPQLVINPLTSEALKTITLKLLPVAGFISIDCGLNSTNPYNDVDSGLPFSPDAPYTSAGVNKEISPEDDGNSLRAYYRHVRSFPEGIRNCYTLGPVNIGAKYRVQAEFFYGNYDGRKRPPIFDVYLDVNRWTTIAAMNFSRAEIIALAIADGVDVCLVNIGLGIPYISRLDLRPLPFSMYSPVNSAQSLVVGKDRLNYGGLSQISSVSLFLYQFISPSLALSLSPSIYISINI